MIGIFSSILPIFLLIFLGVAINAAGILEKPQWRGMELLTYFLFFPCLLVQTVHKADFSSISTSNSVLVFIIGITIIFAIGLILKKPMESIFELSPASYSSVFQGMTRWNTFTALAIIEKFASPQMTTIAAIAIGTMIIPINIVNVITLSRWGNKQGIRRIPVGELVRNPLIIAVLTGLALNFYSIELYEPLDRTLELLSRVALPLGLMLVGSGLRFALPSKTIAGAVFTGFLKLIVVPAVFVGLAVMFGLSGDELAAVAICGCVPTATSGYILAQQLGGDATLFSAIATLQTAAALFTIPLALLLVNQLAG